MKTFKTFLNEGVNDPAIFKAVFLAGGPGSGKSFIVGKTGLTSMGYRVSNSDDAFEAGLKKAGLEMSPENIFSIKGQELRGKATAITKTRLEMYIKGRLGLVVDGTGKNLEKMKTQAKDLKKIGYDVAMIFVNTDLETAMARNRARARKLPDDMVKEYWQEIQNNIGAFQTLFGKKNFLVVDNSDGKDWTAETLRAYKDVTRFTAAPIDNAKSKKWIASEKKKKTR
jgi:shikimate kinase